MATFAPAVVYSPDIEHRQDDEEDTIAELATVFTGMARTVAEHEGHAHRAVHAKGHALLNGRFQVLDGLPAELAHGLFATAGSYEALVRLSSPPAEQLPDNVSTPRGLALKLVNLQAVRERYPDCRYVFTVVAGVNAPMNAVNDLLGFRDVERALEMQRRL